MKIYAIRDRLMNYWQQPFAGLEHGAVKAAVARIINGEQTSDIAQAPHHFEIHQLGYVTEEGHLVPEREFICDASSLIRTGVRPGADTRGGVDERGRETTNESLGGRQGAPYGAGGETGAGDGAVQGRTPSATGKGQEETQ